MTDADIRRIAWAHDIRDFFKACTELPLDKLKIVHDELMKIRDAHPHLYWVKNSFVYQQVLDCERIIRIKTLERVR